MSKTHDACVFQKHHYRELTPEAQQSLGEIPDKFVEYWLSRFPYLLSHAWCALQDFRKEATFKNYYDNSYRFSFELDNITIDSIPDTTTMLNWRLPINNVDWSPTKARYRHKKRPERRRIDEQSSPVWNIQNNKI